jgi:hypothetical protein
MKQYGLARVSILRAPVLSRAEAMDAFMRYPPPDLLQTVAAALLCRTLALADRRRKGFATRLGGGKNCRAQLTSA